MCKQFFKSTDITLDSEICEIFVGQTFCYSMPYNVELFSHIWILIEIPAEKNESTVLGQRGGALAVLANNEDS